MSKRRVQLDLGDYFSSNAKKQTNVDDVTPATEQSKKKITILHLIAKLSKRIQMKSIGHCCLILIFIL